MIKRTVEISQQPVHVCVRQGQLRLLGRENPVSPLATIPCEDIGLLIVDEQGTTYTHSALTDLLENDAAVVLCASNHLPVGLLLPLSNHTEVRWRVQDQIDLRKPLKKQLWRQLVQAKIRAQAANLSPSFPERTKLLRLARGVRSGDPTNVEAHAAKVYWSAWLDGTPFRRDPDDQGVNALLNYGYAVLRAAVARALVSAGLLPILGIHHADRSNAFCLADDMMEPLRPIVDLRVRELVRAGCIVINPQSKRALLETLTVEVSIDDACGPLLVALHRMVASLVRCYEGAARVLQIPRIELPGDDPRPPSSEQRASGSTPDE